MLERLLVSQIRALQKYAKREKAANPSFGFVPKFRILSVGETPHSPRIGRAKKGRPSTRPDTKRVYTERRLTKRDAILALFVRSDQPVTIEELKRVYKAAGGRPKSLGALLSRMQIQGMVRRGRRKGLWVRGPVLRK